MTLTQVEAGATAPRPARQRRSGHRAVRAATVFVLVLGAALRLVSAFGLSDVNSDEALSGLMARELLERGSWPAFLWGQPNGGTPELGLVALAQAALGESLVALRLATFLLGIAQAVLTWRVGRRLAGPVGGAVAGLATWIWPAGFIFWSTREYLYNQPVLVLGVAAMLLALRALEVPGRRVEPALLGLVLGIGWWVSPNIAYFALPVLAALALRPGWVWRRGWLVVPPALLGAAPWLVANVGDDWSSIVVPERFHHGTYGGRLEVFFTEGTPVALGLVSMVRGVWVVPGGAALAVAGGLGFLLLAARELRSWLARRDRPLPVDVVGLVAMPFLYALSPIYGNPNDVVLRYFFFAWPFVCLAVGRLLRSPRLAVAGLVVLLGLSWPDARLLVGEDLSPEPPPAAVLATSLEGSGVESFFASYWIAYAASYESGGAVIGTPAYPPTVRHDRSDRRVRADPAPAWVFTRESVRLARFEAALVRLGVASRRDDVAGYVVHHPARPVLPEELPTDVLVDPVEGV